MTPTQQLRQHRRQNWFYWIRAKDPETGKPYLIAGGATEEEARAKGLECLSGIDFEIKRLNTVNLNEASHKWKGERLEKTHSLHKAAQRVGHERTVKRDRERRLRKRSLSSGIH